MKKLMILILSLGFAVANISQADRTSLCESSNIAKQINAAEKGDVHAKNLYEAHCGITGNPVSDYYRCEKKLITNDGRSVIGYACAQATLKE